MIDKFQQVQITQHLEYQEAQCLRIQLQTGELMMTSLKESFQETSESERQAVISAQPLAISRRHCRFVILEKNEVLRFTKEVADQSTKRIVAENPSRYSSGCVARVNVRWSARFVSLCRLKVFCFASQLACVSRLSHSQYWTCVVSHLVQENMLLLSECRPNSKSSLSRALEVRA